MTETGTATATTAEVSLTKLLGAPIKKKVAKKTVNLVNPSFAKVRELILSAGTRIGSVYFNKRGTNELRKMTYRLHVHNPTTASVPKTGKQKEMHNILNAQMTVLDTNKVVRDVTGAVVGRGAWRTVPLEKVVRVTAGGVTYNISRT